MLFYLRTLLQAILATILIYGGVIVFVAGMLMLFVYRSPIGLLVCAAGGAVAMLTLYRIMLGE